MAVTFDHIAFTAASCAAGRSAFEVATGVSLPLGGEHPNMGTHNCLSAMGGDQFLELITIDQDAPAPDRPRWFALDRLPDDQPLKPHAVIIRSDDLDGDLAKAKAIGVDLGTPVSLTRGNLSWRFAIRDDGDIPLDGAAPMLMQWDQADPHPAVNMTDQGIRLKEIKITTPNASKLTELCDALGWSDPVIAEGETHLSFTLSINGTQVTL